MKRRKRKRCNCFKVEQKLFSIGPLKSWKVQNEVKPQSIRGCYKTKRTMCKVTLHSDSHHWMCLVTSESAQVSNKVPFCICIGQTNWSIVGANHPSLWVERLCVLKGFWFGARRSCITWLYQQLLCCELLPLSSPLTHPVSCIKELPSPHLCHHSISPAF